jgi:hypothetical protein
LILVHRTQRVPSEPPRPIITVSLSDFFVLFDESVAY